jgi:hypothetical protein
MANAKTTPSALLHELDQFASNLGPLDYTKLMSAAYEADYRYKLVQKSAELTSTGATLVTFEVLVGKTDVPFELFDTVSIVIEPGQSSVSLAARVRVVTTLIYLFFGRLPPEVRQPAAPVQTVRTDDVDIVLPREEDDGGEYIDDPADAPLDVVDHHEPDGVPIFVDLYALGDPSADVIYAVLEEVENFLERAQSVETINALALKNPELIKFIKDLGTEADTAKFRDMVSRRKALVAPPVLSNARRRPAAGAN